LKRSLAKTLEDNRNNNVHKTIEIPPKENEAEPKVPDDSTVFDFPDVDPNFPGGPAKLQ